MEEIRISDKDLVIYLILLNVALGILFGTFPLIAGIKAKNLKYGIIGFIGSVLGGAIVGIFLSYPIAAIFTWLILRKPLIHETQDNGSTMDMIDPPAELSETQ